MAKLPKFPITTVYSERITFLQLSMPSPFIYARAFREFVWRHRKMKSQRLVWYDRHLSPREVHFHYAGWPKGFPTGPSS